MIRKDDRDALIRVASSLPPEDVNRGVILSSLLKQAILI